MSDADFSAVKLVVPEREPQIIFPAQDHTADDFFYGFWLDDVSVHGEKKTAYCLVTSSRDIVPIYWENGTKNYERGWFDKFGVRLREVPDRWDDNPRWGLAGLHDYIYSSSPAPQAFELVHAAFEKYVDPPDAATSDFLSLWVMGTYLYTIFDAYPYVHMGGFAGTGKSQTINVATLMAFNGVFSTDISSSSIFRIIEDTGATLGIDESESLVSTRASDFRNILLGGYFRGGKVYRQEKRKTAAAETFRTEQFHVFSPKIFGSIGSLDPVLADRTIEIIMKLTDRKEIIEAVLRQDSHEWAVIRDACYRFGMANWRRAKAINASISREIECSGRDWQLWKPILVMAKLVSDAMYGEIIEFAKIMIAEKKQDKAANYEALLIISLLRACGKDAWHELKDIKKRFFEEFMENEAPEKMGSRSIGSMLKKLGFGTHKRKGGKGNYIYFIDIQTLARTAGKYLAESLISEVMEGMEDTPLFAIFFTCSPASQHSQKVRVNSEDSEECEHVKEIVAQDGEEEWWKKKDANTG